MTEAVVMDLKIHGELWEDFCDNLIVAERAGEPKISIEEVEENLRSLGKLVE